MSSVIGVPSSQELASTTRPYRKAPMTTALPSYTTSGDVTRCAVSYEAARPHRKRDRRDVRAFGAGQRAVIHSSGRGEFCAPKVFPGGSSASAPSRVAAVNAGFDRKPAGEFLSPKAEDTARGCRP
jgi:hypothetical protein